MNSKDLLRGSKIFALIPSILYTLRINKITMHSNLRGLGWRERYNDTALCTRLFYLITFSIYRTVPSTTAST
jgi:hypothetical protein